LDFNEYQQKCERTANRETSDPIIFLTEKALGIVGEAGEIGDYLKKVICHGHPMNTEKLKDEAGDLLWYLSTVLTTYGITLEKVALHNIEKLKRRYPEGFSRERSINRMEGGSQS
jgi:NTP pyrophosphatase (non-canonical NTP hydrolase)